MRSLFVDYTILKLLHTENSWRTDMPVSLEFITHRVSDSRVQYAAHGIKVDLPLFEIRWALWM